MGVTKDKEHQKQKFGTTNLAMQDQPLNKQHPKSQ